MNDLMYINLYIKFLVIRKGCGKPPNVNGYPTFRIIYFTFLSVLRIVFFSLCQHIQICCL